MSHYLSPTALCSARRIIPLLRVHSLQSNSQYICNKHRTIWTFYEVTMNNYCCHGKRNTCSGPIFKPFFKGVQLSQHALSRPVSPTKYPMPVLCRNMMNRSSPKRQEFLRIKDGVPSGYSLVYRAPMSLYLAVVQGVSTASLLLLFGGTVYNVTQRKTEFPSIMSRIGGLFENDEQLLLFGLSLLILSLSLTIFVSKYPVRIYNSEGSYISVFNPHLGIGLPMLRRAISFQRGDVTHLKPKGILPWKESKYRIQNKEVILLDDFFRRPADLHKMMVKS